MEQVSVFEAKARLSQLISRAQSGRETLILKRGRPVARIVPAEPAGSAEQAAAIDAIIAFSKTVKVKGKVNLRRAIASGRL